MKSITIIGAGLGGLTAGALLSKEGYKVTILEQHYTVGGCATTFKRKGFTCEVGLHETNAVFDDGSKKEIFDALGVYDHVEFVRPSEFFRVSSSSIEFTMPDDADKAIMCLCEKYPEEENGIKAYFRLIENISAEYDKLSSASKWKLMLFPFFFKHIVKYRTASVKEVMDGLMENEALKLILNTNIGYYTDTIKDFSFLFHANAQYSYYKGGGWYIKGGSQKLSDYLASTIKENGGEVITGAEVIKINHSQKKCTSITYLDKREKIDLITDIVISNLAPSSTYRLADISYTETKKTASSLLSIYIGFQKNLKSLYGKRAYSTFLLRDAKSIDDYDKNVQRDVVDRGIVFVDYSQIDSGLTDESKSFGAICTTDYLADWKDLSDEEYKRKKEDVLESYLSLLETEYPNIKDNIEFSEVGTPKTIQRYIKTPNGTAYGFAPDNKQFFRIPEIKSKELNNLYFVGAWVVGGGFTPAINSGGMCYHAII
jgi:all-trans-retinol 13,14-reductase